ncbi:MAG: DUF2914 domain-containing protein [Vicinamibacterales bacterium]
MTDLPDLASLLRAAEAAAGAGDYESAEALLRDAAGRQEATLGASHPDVAETMNNLAVVYEMTGQLDEAERCYRRAVRIATTALPAGHEIVTTSLDNLRDFCQAHDIAFESPDAGPAAATPAADVATPAADVATPAADAATPATPAAAAAAKRDDAEEAMQEFAEDATPVAGGAKPAARDAEPAAATSITRAPTPPAAAEPEALVSSYQGSRWPLRIGILVVAAAGIAAVLIARPGTLPTAQPAQPLSPAATPGVSPGPDTSSAAPERQTPPTPDPEPATPPPATPSPAAATPAAATPPAATPPAATPSAATPSASSATPTGASPTGIPYTSADGSVTLVDARLCQSLATTGAEWRCEGPDDPADPGRMSFYTRIRTPRNTTIQHRWYYGTQLTQSVDLRIGANPGAGYRTFSRQTINPANTGEWRVEIRSATGELLHEVRFVVR